MIEEEDLIFDDRGASDLVWSVSSLKTISSCGKQWWFRYRTNEKQVQTPYLAFGKAVHKVIETIHRQNNFSDSFWPREWNDRWAEYSTDVDFTGFRKLTFNNSGAKMIGNYVDTNQNIKLLELEQEFPTATQKYTIGPFVMKGVVDQVRRTDGGRLLIVDLKTSKYPPDPLILRADPQFTIYWRYAKEKYKEDPLLALYHLESGKMFYTSRTDSDVELVEAMIKEGQIKVDQELFQRNITNSCKFCPFRQTCLGAL